jgi:hypothetical protein
MTAAMASTRASQTEVQNRKGEALGIAGPSYHGTGGS